MTPKNCLQNNSIDLMQFPSLSHKNFEKRLELMPGARCKPCTQKVCKAPQVAARCEACIWAIFEKLLGGGVLINPAIFSKTLNNLFCHQTAL